jgi:2-keto-3-deoxy-L-fuconate dehydrogenase
MPMSGRLEGRRVLVTHAERYIGPPVVEHFEKEGAHVITDQSEYADPGTVQDVVEQAGRIDVLVANFAGPPRMMPVTNMLTEPTEFEDGTSKPTSRSWCGRYCVSCGLCCPR